MCSGIPWSKTVSFCCWILWVFQIVSLNVSSSFCNRGIITNARSILKEENICISFISLYLPSKRGMSIFCHHHKHFRQEYYTKTINKEYRGLLGGTLFLKNSTKQLSGQPHLKRWNEFHVLVNIKFLKDRFQNRFNCFVQLIMRMFSVSFYFLKQFHWHQRMFLCILISGNSFWSNDLKSIDFLKI